MGIQSLNVPLPQIELLLGQHHNAAAFGRFIGKGGQLSGISQLGLSHPLGGNESSCLPIT